MTAPFDAGAGESVDSSGGQSAEHTSPHTVNSDARYAAFLARAAGLPPGSLGAADALIAEIVESELPEATFRPLAATIGKSTGLDADAFRRAMVKARNAAQQQEPAANGVVASFSSDPDPAA